MITFVALLYISCIHSFEGLLYAFYLLDKKLLNYEKEGKILVVRLLTNDQFMTCTHENPNRGGHIDISKISGGYLNYHVP